MIKKGIFFALIVITALAAAIPANALDYKHSMSYIYFGGSSDYASLVDDTQGSLSEVSPAYFSLDSDGGLLLTSAAGRSFVEDMHQKGIRVVPYLSNDWDRETGIAALENREKLTTQLADAVSTYNLDGVNIDIENVTAGQRGVYVDLVRLLRGKLPDGKLIVVSAAANPWGTAEGWAGSYDYAGLVEYCDYLMIMAYDESYYGSAPGPVAGITFVEKSVKYALSQVSGDQIVLGLPFYGRIWSSGGGYPYGYGISTSAVEKLIADYNGTVSFDEENQSACATITVGAFDTKPSVGGRTLPAGTYVIWYANAQAIKSELALVTEYDLKGAGSWSLGQESEDTWDYYTLWLNGCTFADIQESWAKKDILNAYLSGWMNGVSSAEFSPDTALTRAQSAAILVRMLGLSASTDGDYSFSDCAGHWAEAYIDTARKHSILSGTGGNFYEPDRPVTRAEIAVMLNNILNYSSTLSPFQDVSPTANSWSFAAINALSSQGIINGYPDGSFRPDNHLTRAEMTALIGKIDGSRFCLD